MATYAIGDIHGHYAALQALLKEINFKPDCDQLWFVGDLVNRGPESLQCLRFIKSLQDNAVVVLGNHDFGLLAYDAHDTNQRIIRDYEAICAAADAPDLLAWLAQRPVFHYSAELDWIMVHAGVPPQWDIQQCQAAAQSLELYIQSAKSPRQVRALYGNTPDLWQPDFDEMDALRYTANAFLRQRVVDRAGRMDFKFKGPAKEASAELVPWFANTQRVTQQHRLVFGHWSALEAVVWPQSNVWCIDTGVAWKGRLSALEISAAEPRLYSAG